ncbi:MAG TPA: hypothetical protein VF656_12375 [Pyrinomonadaceae bacterium]|jgi:uncharacterized membrane protein YphA (DoxX/SURF4 family)
MDSLYTTMSGNSVFERAHARVRRERLLKVFTVCTRILLAVGFLPSGLTKALGHRFTVLGLDNPVGFFFEAMYRTGFYWRFIGLCQLAAAILLVIPRTATIGALVYFPLILNIFIITVSLHFQGTPFITGLMLLASIYLLCWDYDKLKHLVR